MSAARIVVACALGASFGLVTSLANNLVSPTDEGRPAELTRAASNIIGSGWAWAALAVVAGAVAGATATAAGAGAVALITATGAYYLLDSVLRDEPLSLYGPEMIRWFVVGVVAGMVGRPTRTSP